jgi:hypothetical protein
MYAANCVVDSVAGKNHAKSMQTMPGNDHRDVLCTQMHFKGIKNME